MILLVGLRWMVVVTIVRNPCGQDWMLVKLAATRQAAWRGSVVVSLVWKQKRHPQVAFG